MGGNIDSYSIYIQTYPDRDDVSDCLFTDIMEEIRQDRVAGEIFDFYGESVDNMEWDNEERIMLDLSKDYPELIFIVDHSSIWDATTRTYYFRGKIEQVTENCEFPEFSGGSDEPVSNL